MEEGVSGNGRYFDYDIDNDVVVVVPRTQVGRRSRGGWCH